MEVEGLGGHVGLHGVDYAAFVEEFVAVYREVVEGVLDH